MGDALREAIVAKNQVPLVALDWSDSIASPDARVEWELWHSTNQVCGRVCARLEAFINEMATPAAKLEKSGAASFSPHFITWACRKDSVEESDCDRLCINKGRYCAPDPISGVDVDAATVAAVRKHGYNGTHVARENLRQLCLHKELNRNVTLNGEGTTTNASSPPSPAPWLWWTYATRHNAECKMTAGQFNRECSARVMAGHGLSEAFVDRVEKCVGDVDADADNPTMELELRLQDDLDDSGRGAIVLMPTVVINLDQYRGRLTGADALRAICAGYRETTEPAVCLARGMETNECEAPGNAGCWHYADPASGKNFSACRDTFRCRPPLGFNVCLIARVAFQPTDAERFSHFFSPPQRIRVRLPARVQRRRRDVRGRRRVRRPVVERLRADVRERGRRARVRVRRRIQARRRVLVRVDRRGALRVHPAPPLPLSTDRRASSALWNHPRRSASRAATTAGATNDASRVPAGTRARASKGTPCRRTGGSVSSREAASAAAAAAASAAGRSSSRWRSSSSSSAARGTARISGSSNRISTAKSARS